MLFGQLVKPASPVKAGAHRAASAVHSGSESLVELDWSFPDCNAGAGPPLHGWDATPSAPDTCRKQIYDGFANDLAHLGASTAPAICDNSEFHLSDALVDRYFPEIQVAGTHTGSNKRGHKQELARRSQRRHRQKAKESAQEKEAELARAMAELGQLQAQHHELQAKNILLEKLSHSREQASGISPTFTVYDAKGVPSAAADESFLTITTSHGTRQRLSTQAASTMHFEQFKPLWREYVQELGQLLVLQGDASCTDAHLTARLQQVTIEASQLLGIIKSLNLNVYKAMLHRRLDGESEVGGQGLTEEQYQFVLQVTDMSEEQTHDMLHLRRLYLIRRGLLAVEKDALTRKLHELAVREPSAADNLQQMTDVSARLCAIATDDYTAYLKVAFALRRGVLRTAQWAAIIVHCYPFFPILETHFEHLAEQHGAPKLHELLSANNSASFAADWQSLDEYIAFTSSSYHAEYVPGLRAKPSTSQNTSTSGSARSLHDMLL